MAGFSNRYATMHDVCGTECVVWMTGSSNRSVKMQGVFGDVQCNWDGWFQQNFGTVHGVFAGDGLGSLEFWVQKEIGDIAWRVGDGLGRFDGWVKQCIGDSAWSVGDGQSKLNGWIQQQRDDSACIVGDGQGSLDGCDQQ